MKTLRNLGLTILSLLVALYIICGLCFAAIHVCATITTILKHFLK
jgi:type II secretory pathway component PulJ